jgi:Zn finger protein HypA/HybF involved in hydrogenase expression
MSTRRIINPKPKKLKCLSCQAVFNYNESGEGMNGISRPRCPGCLEEIDIVNAGEDAYIDIEDSVGGGNEND